MTDFSFPELESTKNPQTSDDSSDEESIEEETNAKRQKLDAIFEESDDDGILFYNCRLCPYRTDVKAYLNRHIKTKKHLKNLADYESSCEFLNQHK